MPDLETTQASVDLFGTIWRLVQTVGIGVVIYYAAIVARWSQRIESCMKAGFKANDYAHGVLDGDVKEVKEQVRQINGNVRQHSETLSQLRGVCPNLK